MQEEKRSRSAHFITLTYDTDSVPITKAGYMSLDKTDVQKFFKRLRKNALRPDANYPIKYYLAGEYGGKKMRPHYHAIIFNIATPDEVLNAWSLEAKALGSVHFGEVSAASIGYCMKYMSKVSKIPMHRNDDRQPEFGLMSKHLGDNYLNLQSIKYHLADVTHRMCLTIEDGKKIAMPRYYKDKIYTPLDKKRVAFETALKSERDAEKKSSIPNYAHNLVQAHLAQFRKHKQKFLNLQNKEL